MTTIHQRAAAALRALRSGEEARPASTNGVAELTERVAHLESALEGLQDAVYRQDVVHDHQIAELRERNAPDPSAPAHRGPRR